MKRLLAWGLVAVFLIGLAGATPSSASDILVLEGSAAEVGKIWERRTKNRHKGFQCVSFQGRWQGRAIEELRTFHSSFEKIDAPTDR